MTCDADDVADDRQLCIPMYVVVSGKFFGGWALSDNQWNHVGSECVLMGDTCALTD